MLATGQLPAAQASFSDQVIRAGYVRQVFAEENATILMPNEATGSMCPDRQQTIPRWGGGNGKPS